MADISIPSVQYEPVGPQGENWAAQLSLAVGNTYTVGLQNNVADNSRAIQIAFATIDNIASKETVTLILGNQQWTIPPFTRETFSLPRNLTSLKVIVGSDAGIVLTIAETRLAADQTNQLRVQQTAAATLLYPYGTPIAANAVQNITEVNSTTLFLPVIGNITYTLILGSVAGNGWIQYLENFGTKDVAITLTAPNTLNGVAAAITLRPGDTAILHSDGSNWFLDLITRIATSLKTTTDKVDVNVAAPVAGQALIATSPTTATWQNLVQGGMTFMGDYITALAASVTCVFAPGAYKTLVVGGFNLDINAGGLQTLGIELSTDGGATWGALRDISAPFQAANPNHAFSLTIMSAGEAGKAKLIASLSSQQGADIQFASTVSLENVKTGVVNAIRLGFGGGANFNAGGTIRIYTQN